MTLSTSGDAPTTSNGPRTGALATFLIGQTLGQAADALTGAVLIITLLGHERGADPSTLLPTIAAATVPYALVGPLAGVLCDHWARRRTLIAANVARAALVGATAIAVTTGDRSMATVVAALLMSTARVAYTLRAAALPEVTRRADIVSADAASLYLGTATALCAGGLGALAAAVDPVLPLALAAVAASGAALLFAQLDVDLGGHGFGRRVPLPDVASEVARLLAGNVSRWAITVTAGHRALLGALFASTVLAAARATGDGAAGYVVTASVTGVATFAGTCVSPGIAGRTSARVLVIAAFGLPAALLGVASVARSSLIGLCAVASTFFVFQIIRVVADSTIQACIPDAARGRVFAIYDVAYNLSYLGGAAVAVTIASTVSPSELLGMAAAAYLSASAFVAVHDGVVVSPPSVVAG